MDQMTIADLEGNFLEVGFDDRVTNNLRIMNNQPVPKDATFAVYRAKDALKLVGGFATMDEAVAYAESFVYRVRMLFLNPLGH